MMDDPSRYILLGMPLSRVDGPGLCDRLREEPLNVTYVNPQSWDVARKQPEYINDLRNCDIVVCDSVAVHRVARWILKKSFPITSLDFSGCAHEYLTLFQEHKWKLVLVGGRVDVASKAMDELKSQYPGIQIVAAYEGSESGLRKALSDIPETQPECVLVGLGMGLQERFLSRLDQAGWQGRALCVGGFFDKVINPSLDYPDWAVRNNMRFVARIISEPGRLWNRYFWDYRIFVWRVFKYIFSGK